MAGFTALDEGPGDARKAAHPAMTESGSSSYWRHATASLLRNMRRREFVRDLLTAGVRADEARKAPEHWIGALYPAIHDHAVNMGSVRYRVGNATPFELYCLCAIAELAQPRTIFEFGTFDGSTTLALARSAPDARVYTLDLPTSDDAPGAQTRVVSEAERRAAGGVGSTFAGTPEASRVVQLWGDSRTFDYREFRGCIDLVFVDACHEEAFVAADTVNALEMVKPGGVVLWHDYTSAWPGVKAVVDRLVQAGEPVVALELTSLALLRR